MLNLMLLRMRKDCLWLKNKCDQLHPTFIKLDIPVLTSEMGCLMIIIADFCYLVSHKTLIGLCTRMLHTNEISSKTV